MTIVCITLIENKTRPPTRSAAAARGFSDVVVIFSGRNATRASARAAVDCFDVINDPTGRPARPREE